MSQSTPQPRYVFIHDDLSAYERASPEEFPDYDEVDSRLVVEAGAPGEADDSP